MTESGLEGQWGSRADLWKDEGGASITKQLTSGKYFDTKEEAEKYALKMAVVMIDEDRIDW